ncbi:MAG: MarR family transcriptional regulator [Microbacteriaceae bacterium]|nr:MarR family transcriptional regulator [Microbacteriaceae bacterium]MCL2795891.1 MarR family transcriptional regulator [Microbacteriaceae bacterium]
MADESALAAELLGSIRLFITAVRKAKPEGELSAAEISALLHIKRAGETTSAAVARLEGISPQAMGTTIAALEARGLIEREKDADDGRRILLRPTAAGFDVLDARRDARTAKFAARLASDFTAAERATLRAAAPLLERLVGEL